MTLKQLIDVSHHDYYGSGNIGDEYLNFDSFLAEWPADDVDLDMNLIYRWDLDQPDGYDPGKACLTVFFIQPRKARIFECVIKEFTEKDIEPLRKYLEPHKIKLLSLWHPF